MTVAALKSAVAEKPERPRDLAQLMAMPSVQAQLKAALPRHMTAERMARIATTEMRKIPKLAQCDAMSFLGAVIQCAQLGLEPGNALGHAYILPFDKREKVGNQWKTVRTEAQVIIGYRGMIDLARRSGQIVSIDARAVYEGDRFECALGLDPKVEHIPDWQNANRADASKLRFVYAVAKLKDGGVQFDVMSRAEVDGIRARSKSADNGPWVTDYAAMAVKSVVRRLFKFLPVSIEMQRAVGLDEMAEQGLSQQNASVMDADFTMVDDGMDAEFDLPPPEATKPPSRPPGKAAASTTAPPPETEGPAYAQLVDAINNSTSAETALLDLDAARHLPKDQYDDLIDMYRKKWEA